MDNGNENIGGKSGAVKVYDDDMLVENMGNKKGTTDVARDKAATHIDNGGTPGVIIHCYHKKPGLHDPTQADADASHSTSRGATLLTDQWLRRSQCPITSAARASLSEFNAVRRTKRGSHENGDCDKLCVFCRTEVYEKTARPGPRTFSPGNLPIGSRAKAG